LFVLKGDIPYNRNNKPQEVICINIIADSALDLNESLKRRLDIDIIPFKLLLDGVEYVDDPKLDLAKFRKNMTASQKAGSACPSPNDFLSRFRELGDVFAITISAKLSGTYNSAILAKSMVLEEHPNSKIHIFDSKTAGGGEALIAMKIKELLDKEYGFEEIVEKVEAYISGMKTYFISESLDNLIKNGRIPRLKGSIASFMNIKPIMGAIDGEILLFEKARGSNKAFARMVEMVLEKGEDFSEKVLSISHANNPERAESLKDIFHKRANFKEIVVMPTAGLTTLYVDIQGVILSY